MAIEINIIELTRQVFGITNFKPVLFGTPGETPNIENVDLISGEENLPKSVLDTPIFDKLIFPDGTIPATGEDYEGIELDDVPVIDISRAKTIVKTPVQGRTGIIKELIALGDYDIRIRGLLVNNDSYDPPEELFTQLSNLCNTVAALDVESGLFRILGIDSLVIERHSFPPLVGFTNVQPYILHCVSDEPLELSITDLF